MAIAFVNSGAAATGTSSCSVAYPTGIAAGNLLVLVISDKYNYASLNGWLSIHNNYFTGVAGSNGIDTGNVYGSIYVKEALGTETGSITITQAVNASAIVARMFAYSKSSLALWGFSAVVGSNNTPGSIWSVTASSVLRLMTGDMLLVASAINSDNYTYSAQSVAATGVTFGATVERQDSGTSSGQDCGLLVTEHPITGGNTVDVIPTYTATASGSATNSPAGGTVFLCLWERLISDTQIAVPNADTSSPDTTAGWSGTPNNAAGQLYTNVDEGVTESASDYVSSSSNSGSSGPYIFFHLGAQTPANRKNHFLRAYINSPSGVTVYLMEKVGGSNFQRGPNGGVGIINGIAILDITEAEANAIVDYSNLYVYVFANQLSAGQSVVLYNARLELPLPAPAANYRPYSFCVVV
jgi:hypothetical protein